MKKLQELPGFILVILSILALFIMYKIAIFLTILFVYLGYNVFYYLDNVLEINSFSPVLGWTFFGLLIGCTAGTLIAAKKLSLPKKLIFFPLGTLLFFWFIMTLINSPLQHSSPYPMSFYSLEKQKQVIDVRSYAMVISAVNMRSAPSAESFKMQVIPAGAQVEVINRGYGSGNDSPWSLVRYGGLSGYVNASYLRE